MASPFSEGAQNADVAFRGFTQQQFVTGNAAYSAADTEVAVAHGLSAAPDWCLLGSTGTAAGIAEGVMWTANATTLTITVVDTQAACTVSYMAGVRS